MLETFLLQHSGVHIILRMPVVERHTQTVRSSVGEEFGVYLSEEVFQPLIEEGLVAILAERLQHGRTVRTFVAWIAGNKIFRTEASGQLMVLSGQCGS